MGFGSTRRVLFLGGVHQLVEIALLAFGCLFLVDELEIVAIELLEKVLSGYFFELAVIVIGGVRKLETNDARLAAAFGTLHLCWNGSARFCPTANLVVIPGCSRKRHCSLLPHQAAASQDCLPRANDVGLVRGREGCLRRAQGAGCVRGR